MRYLSVCSGIEVGQRFGRLTVKEIYSPKRKDQHRIRCSCECGGEIDLRGSQLRHGSYKSCGCFRRDRAGALYRKHGKSKTTQYCMFYDARKRAEKFSIPFDIQPDDIQIPDVCPALGIPLLEKGLRDHRPSLDRIIPQLGYVRGNIAVISFRANRIKSDATPAELLAVLRYMEEAL